MSNDCLISKLRGSVNNPDLPALGDLVIRSFRTDIPSGNSSPAFWGNVTDQKSGVIKFKGFSVVGDPSQTSPVSCERSWITFTPLSDYSGDKYFMLSDMYERTELRMGGGLIFDYPIHLNIPTNATILSMTYCGFTKTHNISELEEYTSFLELAFRGTTNIEGDLSALFDKWAETRHSTSVRITIPNGLTNVPEGITVGSQAIVVFDSEGWHVSQ